MTNLIIANVETLSHDDGYSCSNKTWVFPEEETGRRTDSMSVPESYEGYTLLQLFFRRSSVWGAWSLAPPPLDPPLYYAAIAHSNQAGSQGGGN